MTVPPTLPRSTSGPAAPSHHMRRAQTASFHSSRFRTSSAGSATVLSSDLDSGRFPPERSNGMRRDVRLSDRRLVALANETAAMIQWDRILRTQEPRLSRWRWLQDHGSFTLYARHETQRYAVLAVGVVPASVSELAVLLQSTSPEQHVQRMEALYGDQIKHGAHVHNVDLTNQNALPPLALAENDSVLAQLSVKTAAFTKPSVLSSHEQWCFLDAVYSHKSGEIFEKHLTTISPKDVFSGKSTSKTKEFHDVIAGYWVQPEPAPKDENKTNAAVVSSRVHFYAELFTPKSFGFTVPSSMTALSERAIRHRLERLAQSSARLPQLVQRRRLGIQVLVDSNRIFPPTNVSCVVCDKHLLLAKLCRLCGHGVCDVCSTKYERERAVRGSDRLRIESIRICELCIRRVDAADYAHVGESNAALAPVHVKPDPENAKPPGSALTALLQDALMSAENPAKKASVMTVIKCVLDMEKNPVEEGSTTTKKPVTLTESSTEKEYVHALIDLEVPMVPHTEAAIAQTEGRPYAVDPTAPIESQLEYPIPENEEQRLQVIKDTHIRELGHSEELNIICQMASREMGCFATLVTIVDREELYVAASNVASLEQQSFSRHDAFCSHTIMSENPLIIPHPEADVRFHRCLPVKMLGTKYYCGFPVVTNDTIIGAMCCIDVKSRELTESQYSYLSKLAETAGKLVTLHAEEKERSLSSVQDGSVPEPTYE